MLIACNCHNIITIEKVECYISRTIKNLSWFSSGLLSSQGPAGTVVYSLTGTPQGQQYFQINPASGIITLRASLLSDTSLQYIVSETNYVKQVYWNKPLCFVWHLFLLLTPACDNSIRDHFAQLLLVW